MTDTDIYATAVETKRGFPQLDELVPDALLRRNLTKDRSAGDEKGPLTLAGCLAYSHYPDQFPPRPTLLALEGNLNALWDKIAKPKQLRQKLVNPDQFLNTISELALARTLRDKGYEVTLEYKFAEGRDADVLAEKCGKQYHIDVTNLKACPLPTARVLRAIVSEIEVRDVVVEKIITKFREKFEGPLDRGWPGHPWVALDVAKNDLENVKVLSQTFTRPNWIQELKAHMQHECPMLKGCIIYRSQPTQIRIDVLDWIECSI